MVDGLLRDLSVHLGEIGARMLEFWVKQLLDETAVVGEQQRSLAVVVEATSGIDACGEAELVEGPVPGLRGELAEDAKRFVKQDYHK